MFSTFLPAGLVLALAAGSAFTCLLRRSLGNDRQASMVLSVSRARK